MRIVILTGAGVSAESGLGVFRDPQGIWAKYDPMKLATPEGFEADPDRVHDFYNARRHNLLRAKPNRAHEAFARLQEGLAARGGRVDLVTQNIDDLHERAGAHDVLHMHGELLQARCGSPLTGGGCGAITPWRRDLGVATSCPACGAAGAMRPDVVWFGEVPLHLDRIAAAVAEADLFVAAGTSGSVYPAAGLVGEAKIAGVRTMELNLEPSDNAHLFDDARYGPASAVVPAWVDEVLGAL